MTSFFLTGIIIEVRDVELVLRCANQQVLESCPPESRLAFGIRAVAYAVWACKSSLSHPRRRLIAYTSVFAGLRAYALSWNLPLGLFVFLLQSVPIGINLVRIAPVSLSNSQ